MSTRWCLALAPGLLSLLVACAPRAVRDTASGQPSVVLPTPESLAATLTRLGYGQVSTEVDTGPEPDMGASSEPEFAPERDPNVDDSAGPNVATRRLLQRWAPGGKGLAPAAEDEIVVDGLPGNDVLVTLREVTTREPKTTATVVTLIQVSTSLGQDRAVALASALAPALGDAVRAVGNGPASRDVGQVHVESDGSTWGLRLLQPAVPLLMRALATYPSDVRAAEDLARIGRHAEGALIDALGNPKESTALRVGAAKALAAIPSRASEAALAKALDDQDASLRAAGARGLAEHGASQAVPALVKASQDVDPSVRWCATLALHRSRVRDEHVVQAAFKVLQMEKGDTMTSGAALAIIAGAGPLARPLLPALRSDMEKSTGSRRIAAAEILWEIGGDADAAVPALLAEAATGSKPWVMAREVLLHIGKAAIPALRRAVEGKDPAIRKAAEETLREIEAAK